MEDYKLIVDFMTSISYSSKSNLESERIVELNDLNIRRTFDFISELRENLISSMNDSKNLIDRVNFPETWVIVS